MINIWNNYIFLFHFFSSHFMQTYLPTDVTEYESNYFPTKYQSSVRNLDGLESYGNTSYFEGDSKFVRSRRGHVLLVEAGYVYTLNRELKDTCYWECVKRRLKDKDLVCRTRVITVNGQIKAIKGTHNHSP